MGGKFITFEGPDGSGKSSHLQRTAAWMAERGMSHVVTKEPGGTDLGEALRAIFLDPRWGDLDGTIELLLVFASRRQNLLEKIDPALAAGTHVLCDRFTDSTLAYQGGGRGLARELIDRVDELATGRRRPHHTLLFDLPPAAARSRGHLQRGLSDRLDAEGLDFYERVREAFLAEARREPERIRVIDSSGTFERTEVQTRSFLEEIFGLQQAVRS